MELNISKCKQLRITRSRGSTFPPVSYTIEDCNLEVVTTYKYLGVYISFDLTWKAHVSHLCNVASSSLGFIRRTFFLAPSAVKLHLYKSIIRPKLEYAASVWDPGSDNLVRTIESVQNRAVRFILGNYSRKSSVTLMKNTLCLLPLSVHRKIIRLTLFHRIYHHDDPGLSSYLTQSQYTSARVDHLYKVHVQPTHSKSFF